MENGNRVSKLKEIRNLEQRYGGTFEVLKPTKADSILLLKEDLKKIESESLLAQDNLISLAKHLGIMDHELELKECCGTPFFEGIPSFQIDENHFVSFEPNHQVKIYQKKGTIYSVFTLDQLKKSGSLIEKLHDCVSDYKQVLVSLCSASYAIQKEGPNGIHESIVITRKCIPEIENKYIKKYRLEYLMNLQKSPMKLILGLEQYPEEELELYLEQFFQTRSLKELTPTHFLTYLAEKKELFELPSVILQYRKAIALGKVVFEFGELMESDTTNEKGDSVKKLAYQLSSSKSLEK